MSNRDGGKVDKTVEEARPGQVRNEAQQEESAGRASKDKGPGPDVSKTVEGSRGEQIRK